MLAVRPVARQSTRELEELDERRGPRAALGRSVGRVGGRRTELGEEVGPSLFSGRLASDDRRRLTNQRGRGFLRRRAAFNLS